MAINKIIIDLNMNQLNKSGWGGARAGAGRPKGSGNKVRIEDLLDEIENATGVTYAEQLASNYASAINREDWTKVGEYDRAFLNKIVADKTEIEVVESEDAVLAKQQAFAEALTALVAVNRKDEK